MIGACRGIKGLNELIEVSMKPIERQFGEDDHVLHLYDTQEISSVLSD